MGGGENQQKTQNFLYKLVKKGLKITFTCSSELLSYVSLKLCLNESGVETRIASQETTIVKMAFYKKF